MSMKHVAMWLAVWGLAVALAASAVAQVPANSNLDYQTSNPSYEHGNAPFSNATPESHRSIFPFHPMNFEPQAQPFAPAQTSGYGNGPRAKIGWFGSYERVFWSIGAPERTDIGSPTAEGFFTGPSGQLDSLLQNSLDTGFMTANGAWGNRWELGYVDDDNYGFLLSVLDHVSQGQNHHFSGVQVLFDDPGFLLRGFLGFTDPVTNLTIDRDLNGDNVHGRDGTDVGRPNPAPPPALILPPDGHPDRPTEFGDGFIPFLLTPAQLAALDTVFFVPVFTEFAVKNVTTLNGVEVMRFYRPARMHHGGFWDVLYGVRWLQMDDVFSVFGVGGILDQSTWSTRAQNNMVGPQFGLRFSSQKGRWISSIEGRVMAAANFQNILQKTAVATNAAFTNPGSTQSGLVEVRNAPANLLFAFGTSQHLFSEQFSPVGEIRVNVVYQATKAAAIKVGYTGIVMGNVTRASTRVAYNDSRLFSIRGGGDHQTAFSNGINFGVEFNR